MEIYGTFIMDDYIIGISSLERINRQDIYGTFYLVFYIYTKAGSSIEIHSSHFTGATNNEYVWQFQTIYCNAYTDIYNMLGRGEMPSYITEMQEQIRKAIQSTKK